jgi:hypothetical protein
MAVSNLVVAAAGATVTEGNNAGWGKGPMDITWTQLGYTNPSGTTTCTFSSLGGYKYIRLVGIMFNTQNSATNLAIRINADSTGSMYINGNTSYAGTNGSVGVRTAGPNTYFDIGQYGTGYDQNYLELEFINPTQTDGKKMMKYNLAGYDGSTFRHHFGTGIYNSNSALTSISLLSTNGYAFGGGNGSPTGFYVYGAN